MKGNYGLLFSFNKLNITSIFALIFFTYLLESQI